MIPGERRRHELHFYTRRLRDRIRDVDLEADQLAIFADHRRWHERRHADHHPAALLDFLERARRDELLPNVLRERCAVNTN